VLCTLHTHERSQSICNFASTVDDVSFDAADAADGAVINIDVAHVNEKMGEVQKRDLAKYIL
jgi:ATP-dependent protease HslVU (ClpYQ) ATPase subunit